MVPGTSTTDVTSIFSVPVLGLPKKVVFFTFQDYLPEVVLRQQIQVLLAATLKAVVPILDTPLARFHFNCTQSEYFRSCSTCSRFVPTLLCITHFRSWLIVADPAQTVLGTLFQPQ